MLDFCATPSVLAKQKCLKNYIACPKDIAVRDLACVQSTEKVQKQTVRSASNTSDIETESLMKHIHLLQCQLERAQMGQSVENERANQAEKLLKQEKETFKTSQVRAHQRISALEEMVSTLQERVREEQKKVIEAEKIVLKEQNRAMIAEEKARVLEKKIGDKTKIDDAVVQNSAEYFPARFRTVETQTDYVDCETDNGAEKSSAQTLTFPVMLAADMIKRANDRVLLAEERLKAALKCIDEVQAKTEDANYTAKRAAEMLHQIEQCTHVSDIDKLMSQNKKLKRE